MDVEIEIWKTSTTALYFVFCCSSLRRNFVFRGEISDSETEGIGINLFSFQTPTATGEHVYIC